MKCAACRVPASIPCAYESRRVLCDQPGGPYFGAHATGGDDFTTPLFPDAWNPAEFSPGKPRIDLATYQSRRFLVAACDYRGPKSQCGCTEMHVCFLRKGRARDGSPDPDVTLKQCLECVSG